MKPISIVGVALIVLGVVALAYQGFTYTTRETVIDIGPLKATTERQKTLPLPPIVGGLALVGGIVLLVAGSRKPNRLRIRPHPGRARSHCGVEQARALARASRAALRTPRTAPRTAALAGAARRSRRAFEALSVLAGVEPDQRFVDAKQGFRAHLEQGHVEIALNVRVRHLEVVAHFIGPVGASASNASLDVGLNLPPPVAQHLSEVRVPLAGLGHAVSLSHRACRKRF